MTLPQSALAGSEREPLAGSRSIGSANPSERLEVTLILRRRLPPSAGETFERCVTAASAGSLSDRVTHAEYEAKYGAARADIDAVRTFAQQHRLAVVRESSPRRTVILSGTVADFGTAFGTALEMYEHDEGTYRGRTGSVMLPAELAGIVLAVLGLDNRPQAKPHFRLQSEITRAAAATSFYPTQIADFYRFPASSGSGQCVALIELGGGYTPADLQAYFATLKIAAPAVVSVGVDHAKNAPTGSANGPDGEVMLDIEVVGAVVPGAKIAVYFAPNTDAGFLNAITTAIHDTVNTPSIISISWGGPESSWTAQAMTAFDQAFQAAATLGITICVATGDNGSSDGATDGANHVDFPASSPYALGCGGTGITVDGTTITAEHVWNDGASGGAGGGGVSTFFARPAWQTGLTADADGKPAPLAMRGLPDVCGDADPESGYIVRVDGQTIPIGGTSAVAPLWAALIARGNALNGTPAGYVNPKLYANPSALTDITTGNNGAFAATPGWDACTGLGSPIGDKVQALFK